MAEVAADLHTKLIMPVHTYVVVNISPNYVQNTYVFPELAPEMNCILYQCPSTSKTTLGFGSRKSENLKALKKVLRQFYHHVQRQGGKRKAVTCFLLHHHRSK